MTRHRSEPLELRPLGQRLGAEVRGLALDADLPGPVVDRLVDALLDHKVLVFRRQSLSSSGHARLVQRFGDPVLSPHSPTAGPATARSARWIAEGSAERTPPKLVTFRAEAPPRGERTLFADAAGAYGDLPRQLRALADRSWALHSREAGARRDLTASPDHDSPIAHPVVRLHPETGDRALLLGGFARRLVGLTGAESRTLLPLLQSYLVRPTNLLQWTWSPGDVLLVDARVTQRHDGRGTGAPDGVHRHDVAGDAPLGIDGQHSHRVPWSGPPGGVDAGRLSA
jgi:taurine dioxygenase